MRPIALVASCLFLSVLSSPADADDGLAEIKNGVITFSKSDAIAMKSEVLAISLDKITADFTFLNTASTDQEVTVAFPLPEIDMASSDGLNIPVETSDDFFGFTTEVDGKAITSALEQRAFLPDGKEVTAEIKTLGLPMVRPYWDYVDLLKNLPEDKKKQAVASGVAVGELDDLSPNYIVRSNYYFKATFPAGKPVRIVHAYKPSYDVSNMTVFSAEQKPEDETVKTYCLTDETKKAVQAAEANIAGEDINTIPQFMLDYILATAKTWSGPIGSFHLIVDTKPGQILATCLPLKKTGETRYEMMAPDFVPDQDIHLMLFGGTFE